MWKKKKVLYNEWLDFLHNYKLELQNAKKLNPMNINYHKENLNKFIYKCRDRNHDFKAGHISRNYGQEFCWFSDYKKEVSND